MFHLVAGTLSRGEGENESRDISNATSAIETQAEASVMPEKETVGPPVVVPETRSQSSSGAQKPSSSKIQNLKKKNKLDQAKQRAKEKEAEEKARESSTDSEVPVADSGGTRSAVNGDADMPSKPSSETSNENTTRVERKASAGDKLERLSKLVEALRKKNQRLENENAQLEEMVSSLDINNKENVDEIRKLNMSIKQLNKSKEELENKYQGYQKAMEEAQETIDSKQSTIEQLQQKLSDKEKESVNATAERNASETHIIASLRKDVEAAESLLENERKAHALSRRNFATREHELDESITKAANALAESQAKIDDYSSKLTESQERCTVLEAEIENLSRQIKSLQPNSAEDPSSSVSQERVKELESDLSAALRDAANTRNEVKTLEGEVSRIQSENINLKHKISKLEASDMIDLQKRVKELTDMLYSKQSHIENLTAEKDALQMQLDKQLVSSRPDSMRRRSAAVDKFFSGDSYDNVVPMNALGPGYERLANAPGHIGGAVQASAKLLDRIALQAVILIRQSPLWRLGVFGYLLGMHLFIYVLLFFHSHQIDNAGPIMDPTAVHRTG